MRSMFKYVVLASVFAVFALSAVKAQTVRTVYIDASENNGPAGWNNLAFNALGASRLLNDSMTNATGIRATVAVRLNGANTNGSTSPSGDAAEFAPAGGNSSYGHTTVWSGTDPILYGEVVFSNMNPTVAYDFTFYGSRMSITENRETRYTVTGSNSGTALLNVTTNSTRVVSVPGIYPTAEGTLVVRVEKGPANNNSNGFYHITALKFTFTDPAPTVAFVDARGASAPAGWNLLNCNDYSAATLAATNGASTGIRALVTAPFDGANSWGSYTHTGDAAEFAPAGVDACHFGSGGTAVIKLYNMKPAVPYTFTFFACRPGVSDFREATYSVIGFNAASNTLDASSNTDKVAVVENILPAADGTITVRINRGLNNTGGFIYLTAFKVSYIDNGLPPSEPEPIAGKRVLILGNHLFSQENIHDMLANVAAAAGHPRPLVVADIANNRTLPQHITRVNDAALSGWNVDHPLLHGTNTWDHVVIQGQLTDPTHVGDPAAFRANVVTLYQAVKNHATGKGATAAPVLFQAYARGPGHSYYPAEFADPAAMQQEINVNTQLAADDLLAAEPDCGLRIAPVGETYAFSGFDTVTLYANSFDLPAKAGPELIALVLFKTLYGGNARDIGYEAANAAGVNAISERDWLRVTHWADGLPDPVTVQRPAPGSKETILIDACPNPTGSPVYLGWNYRTFNAIGSLALVLTNDYPTPITCQVVTRMNGTSSSSAAAPVGDAAIFTKALANNVFGNINPWGTSSYSNEFCEVRFSGLSRNQSYTFTFYASRTGATGRHTRYIVTGVDSASADLEPGNNDSQVAVISGVRPAADGTVDLRITAGPNNTSNEKFYHINAMMIETVRGGTVFFLR